MEPALDDFGINEESNLGAQPDSFEDDIYMVLKYDEGRWIHEGSGPLLEELEKLLRKDTSVMLLSQTRKTFCLTAIKGPTIFEKAPISHRA